MPTLTDETQRPYESSGHEVFDAQQSNESPRPVADDFFASRNLPRSVAFARCPSLYEAMRRTEDEFPLLRARMSEGRISAELQLRCSEFADPLLMLAIVSFDIPDVVGVLPLWNQMANSCPRAEMRIITDEEMPLLERILNGDSPLDLDTLEMPLLLFLDEEFLVQAQWGPRPQAAERYIEEWLAQHPDFERLAEDESPEGSAAFAALSLDLTRYMRIWYNSALDAESSVELDRLLASLQGDSEENGA